jgi:hypothetical protein
MRITILSVAILAAWAFPTTAARAQAERNLREARARKN